MAANPLPLGDALPDLPREATVIDLLRGRQPGWREHGGRRAASELDPVRLVQDFRRIGACGHGLGRPLEAGGKRVSDALIEVLYLALRERGWIVSKKAVVDAWWLASLDPQGPEANDAPF